MTLSVLMPSAATDSTSHLHDHDHHQTMQCMEVWGGNQVVDKSVSMAGLDAWVYCRPFGQAHWAKSERVAPAFRATRSPTRPLRPPRSKTAAPYTGCGATG